MNMNREKLMMQRRIPEDLQKLFKQERVMLAGGFFTSLLNDAPINDLDVYFRTEDEAYATLASLLGIGYKCMSKTDLSYVMCRTKDVTVNVIVFDYFGHLHKVFDCFDYTVCMCGYDFEYETFGFHPDFFKDVLTKTLRIGGQSRFPLGALFRMQKYIQRGFNIHRTELVRLFGMLKDLEINTTEDMKAQIGAMYGIDLDSVWPTDEPFDLHKFIDKLSATEIEWVKKPEYIDLQEDDLWNKCKFEKFVIGARVVTMRKSQRIDIRPVNHDEDVSQMRTPTAPMYFYKDVKRTDKPGIYRSKFKPEFTYMLNCAAYSGGPGIFCRENKNCSFPEPNTATLKLKVMPEDIIKFDAPNQITARKVFVVEEL